MNDTDTTVVDNEVTGASAAKEDILEAVREASVLADVSIAVWGGTRTDNKLLDELKTTHNAKGDVGRVIKNLLAGADGPLSATRAAYMAIRTRHYQLTLPWVSDPHASRKKGPRLLSKLLIKQYLDELGKLNTQAINLRDDFLDQYPDLVERAKENLGGMVGSNKGNRSLDEYPTVDELRNSFRAHIDIEPLPETASFKGMDEFTLQRFSKILSDKQTRQANEALKVLWQRVTEPLKHLIERLEDQDAKFKSATIENLRELVTLLPGWNMTGDKRLVELTSDLDRLLAGINAKELRKNKQLRTTVVDEARKISAKLHQSWGL